MTKCDQIAVCSGRCCQEINNLSIETSLQPNHFTQSQMVLLVIGRSWDAPQQPCRQSWGAVNYQTNLTLFMACRLMPKSSKDTPLVAETNILFQNAGG